LQLHLDFKIEKQDIVGIVHYAWNASFARVETNKKAIANRGWYPANYILLDSKELDKNKNNMHVWDAYTACELTRSQPEELSKLHLATGLSKTLFDQVVEYKARDKRLRLNEQRRFARNMSMLSTMQFDLQQGKHSRPINASLMKKSMTKSMILITRKKRKKRIRRKERKCQRQHSKKRLKMQELRGGPDKWSVDELKTTVLWYKCPGDTKIPTTKSSLYQRYLLTCMRSEEDMSRLKEGEIAVQEETSDNEQQ